MSVNRDFRDIFKLLNSCHVKYLIVGAHAVMYYTEPRYTKDIDIWIYPSPKNAAAVWRALSRFGAPLDGVMLDDFTNPQLVYQVGIAPNRIDVMMGLPGVRFETAWKRRTKSSYGDVPINILHKNDLLKSKRFAGRPQDLLDVSALANSTRRGNPK
jgi:hypothetical protein